MKKLYEEDSKRAEIFFRNLNGLAVRQNQQFLDEMFSALRETSRYADFALVDEEGRKYGQWATFLEMLAKKEPVSDREILEDVIKHNRLFYFVGAPRSRLLFFLQNDAEAVNGVNGGDLSVFLHSRLYDGTAIGGAWVNPRRSYEHAPKGYAIGRITFWDTKLGDRRVRSEPENRDTVLVTHSAYILDHPAIGGKVTITPLKRSGVVATGGLPVDVKYKNYRVEVDQNYLGFVAGAIEAYRHDNVIGVNPLVLAYSSRRRLEFVHNTPGS